MNTVAGLRLFVRVVETGRFSRASSGQGITQPTATKHVATLERRLGARRLHRSTRGVTPTEIGALYGERCKALLRQLDEADGHVTSVPVRGPLRRNNLSALLAAARAGMGRALLPRCVAHASLKGGAVLPLLGRFGLPAQAIHAVFPSPSHVPQKVAGFADWLEGPFGGEWWSRAP